MEDPLDVIVIDVFLIRHRGPVVAGTIRGGLLRIGDDVEVVRPDGATVPAKIRSIEFLDGPNVRRDAVGFQLDPHDDAYIMSGSVIRSPAMGHDGPRRRP